jgi:hypothetical protein
MSWLLVPWRDPHGPMRERWEQLTEAERDFYLGLAIQHLDSIVSGGERGDPASGRSDAAEKMGCCGVRAVGTP